MTIRGNFQIQGGAVALGTGANSNKVTITLGAGAAGRFCNYTAFQNEADNSMVDVLRKSGVGGGAAGNTANVTTNSPIHNLVIVCKDKKEAKEVFALLHLKNKIKASGLGTDGNGANTNPGND
jgi:hypothetical protein